MCLFNLEHGTVLSCQCLQAKFSLALLKESFITYHWLRPHENLLMTANPILLFHFVHWLLFFSAKLGLFVPFFNKVAHTLFKISVGCLLAGQK